MARSILDIIIRTIKQGGGDKETVKGLVEMKKSIGTAVTAFTALAGAAYTVNKVLDQTVGVFVDYAQKVEDATVLTGAGIEETSRIIQLADDLGVTYESLTKSLKAANKDGFQPNIEGLATLSDEFLSIQDPIEQSNFLFDKFGKTGDDMAKVMRLGGDGVREWAESIDGSLVLTEQSIQRMHEYKLAQDSFNDAIEESKVQLGEGFIPVLTDVINHMNAVNEADKRLAEQGIRPYTKAWYDQRAALVETIKAEQDHQNSLRESTAAMDAAGESAEAMAAHYGNLLSITLDLQEGYDKFAEKEQMIRAEMDALTVSVANGEITAEEYNKKFAELSGQLDANAQAMEDWSKRTVFSLVQARLAAEGGIDANEFKFLIGLGEQMGIIDENTATMAQSVNDSLDNIDLSKPEDFVDLWEEIIDLPHEQVFTITTETSGSPVTTPGSGKGGRAIGGSVDANTPYLVHQDEIFVPNQNGYVITRTDAMRAVSGGTGGGKHITIYGGLTVIAQGGIGDVLDELG